MKKLLIIFVATGILFSQQIFAQSDDDLFGGSSDTFSEDDMFGDDMMEDQTAASIPQTSSPLSSSDLSHGVLFQNGSVKLGGTFTLSADSTTTLLDKETLDGDKTLSDNIYNTALTPKATGEITLDARPSQTLRMYTKFGMKFPYPTASLASQIAGGASVSLLNSFYVKELFSDFSIKDRAFFRFGLHTVSWGTGYFFSPVSDMINTSSIDVEDPTAQVNGSLNLRTQITFPGTQNCLWFYVIPEQPGSDFAYTNSVNARNTAFAFKGDFVLGGWELGAGAFYKNNSAPKAMLTASGSIIYSKVSVFAEGVYQYGSNKEWNANTDWSDKTNIVQATVGASYYWKTPQITFIAQYYYDSNTDDDAVTTKGNNLAGAISFAKIGTSDLTANIYGIVFFDHDKTYTTNIGLTPITINTQEAIFSAMLNYSPVKELTLGVGPYITFESFDTTPVTALKLTAKLGGGKF